MMVPMLVSVHLHDVAIPLLILYLTYLIVFYRMFVLYMQFPLWGVYGNYYTTEHVLKLENIIGLLYS